MTWINNAAILLTEAKLLKGWNMRWVISTNIYQDIVNKMCTISIKPPTKPCKSLADIPLYEIPEESAGALLDIPVYVNRYLSNDSIYLIYETMH